MAIAGWYDDPAGNPELERYWDGNQWTTQVRPKPGQTQAPPPPPPPPPPVADATVPPPPAPPQPEPLAGDVLSDLSEGGYGEVAETSDPTPPPTAADETPPPPLPSAVPPPPPATVDATPPPPGPAQPAATGSTPPPPGGSSAAPDGVGAIMTDLLTDPLYTEVGSSQRVALQNKRLLKVVLGEPILARQGSMVAFQGQMDFHYEGSGMSKFLKKAMTGEGLSLMRVSGQGELFLADSADQIHIIHLNGGGLTVNGRNVLAFEPSLSWDVERVQGAGMIAGGLFNTRLEGHGWVAITTDGDPVVLQVDQPTYADAQAAVAWSSSLTTSINRTFKAQSLVGRGSGEVAQLAFKGQGIVIVQPSEGHVALSQ